MAYFKLIKKTGESVVGFAYFTTHGEAEGFARHNGYHKPNKKRIEEDSDYKNYEIVEVSDEEREAVRFIY